jgi:group II intron reverse transcriptase/maturase
MYVASSPDKDWLLSKQRALYARSKENHDYEFRKLWGLLTDPANLRIAFQRVARNQGSRTAGVDRITVRNLTAKGAMGVDAFLTQIRSDLRAGTYRPNPVRRVLIPKAGKPGAFRPLGIPTVRDRVVQAALKNILEPIFEADFYPISHGFRPGRGVHGALAHIRNWLRPWRTRGEGSGPPYQWVVEGDIKGCFDNINHHNLMSRVRKRIGDVKVTRLIRAFLKSGVLTGGQFFRTETGTPQGGILSPLLANIALSVLEERYREYLRSKGKLTAEMIRFQMKSRGQIVKVPIRYADDFLILIGAPKGPEQMERAYKAAVEEKAELASFLKEEMGLSLSEEKTLVTPVTSAIHFLGHSLRVRYVQMLGATLCVLSIPKEKSQQLRRTVKNIFRRETLGDTLKSRLELLNPILRGWGYFYRHTGTAGQVFDKLDHYVWWTILRWVRKKHPRLGSKALLGRYAWRKPGGKAFYFREGGVTPFRLKSIPRGAFRVTWLKPPSFASMSMESPVHNERCTPGLEGGGRKRVSAS